MASSSGITQGLENLRIETSHGFAPKMPAGKAGQASNVRTNSIELAIKPNVSIYKYDVRMNELYPGKDGGIKEKELVKQTKDDYLEQERKQKTVILFKHLAASKKLPPLAEMVYDRAAIMFSTKKLVRMEIKLSQGELKKIDYSPKPDLIEVQIIVKPVTEGYQLSSNDVSRGDSKEILEFLNVLTSQVAFFTPGSFIVYGNNNIFLYDPSSCGFQGRDLPSLPEGKYMGVGASKSVKLLEGSNGKPVPVITVDVAKAAFHNDNQPVHEKVAAILDCGVNDVARCLNNQSTKKIVAAAIKGLVLQTTYLGEKNVSFSARGLGLPASQAKFVIDDKETLVSTYFANKYKLNLKFPNLPVIGSNRGSFFPMELLIVAPNQRVTFGQQTPAQMQIQIRACAVAPSTRLQQTDQVSRAVAVAPGSKNPNFVAAGVTIGEKAMTVPGRILPVPTIRDKKNSPAVMGNCRWNNELFFVPASVKNWTVFALLSQNDSKKESMINNLISTLVNTGKQFGMAFEAHRYKRVDQYKIEEAFVSARQDAIKFILFVQSDQLKCHDAIKAFEQKYQILTQDLKFSKVFETSKRDTMKNIVQKMNMKNGGLNHMVVDQRFDQRVLFLGIEFTHPGPSLPGKEPSMPSVLGWSANITAQPQVFVGDYKYIQPRASDDQSEIGIYMKEVFNEAITRFKAARGAPPGLVIIYRNGASEGQYPTLVNEELPLFYKTCDEMSGGKYKPELVMIAVNKDHVHRLYKPQPGGGKPAEQNIMPGTVVDKGIVSALRNEFFLTAHSAFQGTAKTPRYTVIKNGTTKDTLLTMDVIQEFTYALTFGHGIVSMTISIPVVLKVAGECAKRGSNNYKVHYGDVSSSGLGPENVEAANRDLTYSKKPLSNPNLLPYPWIHFPLATYPPLISAEKNRLANEILNDVKCMSLGERFARQKKTRVKYDQLLHFMKDAGERVATGEKLDVLDAKIVNNLEETSEDLKLLSSGKEVALDACYMVENVHLMRERVKMLQEHQADKRLNVKIYAEKIKKKEKTDKQIQRQKKEAAVILEQKEKGENMGEDQLVTIELDFIRKTFLRLLKKTDSTSCNYYEFIFDPDDFGRTVENKRLNVKIYAEKMITLL
ncbi:unnamed protein product, partial [Mesorhabditis belari]|uniref:Piwi domain-containing protein n=1 Tax=Mesorhabditis belari TaxID=2138241 RepID=A0AAF3F5E2_9BILA